MTKNKFIHKFSLIALSLSTSFSLIPLQSIHAASDGPGSVIFDCGEGATTCPAQIDFSSFSNESWKDTVGEKPVPTKEDAEFVDWEFVSGNPDSSFSPNYEIKPGTLLTDWDKYSVGNLLGASGGTVRLKAVWRTSSTGSSIPISISVAATPINITLPSSIDLIFDGSSVIGQISDQLKITNNGKTGNVLVQNITAELKNANWSFSTQTDDSYYQRLPLDSNQIYLGFSLDQSTYTPLSSQTFDPGLKIAPAGSSGAVNSESFYLKTKTGGSSTQISETILNLVMTVGFEAAEPANGLEISEGVVTGYTGSAETLTLPMSVTAIESKALASHPELKTVINNTGRSFDWYDALGEADPSDYGTPDFSEGSTNDVLIVSQTTLDSYNGLLRDQLLNKEIKLTPDSYFELNEDGMISDYTGYEALGKDADIVLPAMKNGQMIYGIDDGTVNGEKRVSSYAIGGGGIGLVPATLFVGPFTDLSFGGSSWDKQNKLIKSITFPDTIEKIGDVAFASLTPVKIMNIPLSLRTIGYYSFMGAEFPGNAAPLRDAPELEFIDEYAFYYNQSLTQIWLPESISVIENNAFDKILSPALTKIVYPGSEEFDWSLITGSSTADQIFSQGTIIHEKGNITVSLK